MSTRRPVAPADACASIAVGVGKTDGSDGADTVFVSPGTYAGGISLSNPIYDGLTIVGSGSGSNPAVDTIISQLGPADALRSDREGRSTASRFRASA